VVGREVTAEDLLAYIAGVVSHAGFSSRFRTDLKTPGLRVPLTADAKLWLRATDIGRRVIWLHTYGERFADRDQGRPFKPPRLAPADRRPSVSGKDPIPSTAAQMPQSLSYDLATRTLLVGAGRVTPVAPGVWGYDVSGMPVVKSWFEYRMKKPAIKRSSPLDDTQPREWTSEQTTELLKLLDVLAGLVDLEPAQDELLEMICSGPLLSVSDLEKAGILSAPPIAGPSVPPAGAIGQVSLPLGTANGDGDEASSRSTDRPTASGRRPSRPVARPHATRGFRQRRTR
jgi:hypothetical protein